MTTSSTEWGQERLRCRKIPSPWCFVHLAIQKEACSREMTRNPLLKQWRVSEMDWGLCLREKPLGPDSEAKMQRTGLCRSTKDMETAEIGDWQRHSPKKHLIRWWLQLKTVWAILQVPMMGGWVRWDWYRGRAGQAERRWHTGLHDWHNIQYGPSAHWEVSCEADDAWQIDATGMGGRSQWLPWKGYQVWHIWIESSGCWYTANSSRCIGTSYYNIWRAYGVSW